LTENNTKSWLAQNQPEMVEFFKAAHGTAPLRFILAETRYKLASFSSWDDADDIGRWAMESRLHHHLSCLLVEAMYAAATRGDDKAGISKINLVREFGRDGYRATSRTRVYAAINDAIERGYFLQRDTGRDVYVFAAMGFLKSHFYWTERQARARDSLDIPRLARDVDVASFKLVTEKFDLEFEKFSARSSDG